MPIHLASLTKSEFFSNNIFVNFYHNIFSPQFFQLDFIQRHGLLSWIKQHAVCVFFFYNASLKARFILPSKPFVLYFSNKNIWGLIKAIKNAVKRSLVKTPAAVIKQCYFLHSPEGTSGWGNVWIGCFMELHCWIVAKVWEFLPTYLRYILLSTAWGVLCPSELRACGMISD